MPNPPSHVERLNILREKQAVLNAEIADARDAFLRSPGALEAFHNEFKRLEELLRHQAHDPLMRRELICKSNSYAMYFDDGLLTYTLTITADETGSASNLVVQLWEGRVSFPLRGAEEPKPLRKRIYVLALSPSMEFGWRHRLRSDEWLSPEMFSSEVRALHSQQLKADAMKIPYVAKRLRELGPFSPA